MSHKRLKARDKVTQKMSRDGLTVRNAATGAEELISKRAGNFDLRGEPPDRFSQAGKKLGELRSAKNHHRQGNRHPGTARSAESGRGRPPVTPDFTGQNDTRAEQQSATRAEQPRTPHTTSPLESDSRKDNVDSTGKSSLNEPEVKFAFNHDDGGRLRFVKSDTSANANLPNSPRRKQQPQADKPDVSEQTHRVAEPDTLKNSPSQAEGEMPLQHGKANASLQTDKPGKLEFTADEAASDAATPKQTRKLKKAQKQANKSATKRDKAKGKLPTKKKLRTQRVFDEKTGKSQRKLYFETEVKSQSAHIKGALPLRPVKAAGNYALAFGHRKIFQVERENVATEAAHKGELAAEGAVRSVLRHHKTAPYRKVAKLERQSAKKALNLTYQKALAENPKLKSNLLSRAFQKRKIKKDYAKTAREAQKAAKQVKQAGETAGKGIKVLTGVIRRHPAATSAVVLISLLLFMLMSLIGAFGGAGSGGLGGILTAAYLAEDADIDNAELIYTEWETDLQLQAANAETAHPGYDEYRYDVGEISHDPYGLMAYLTVMYQNFSYAAIQADLQALFREQYALTFTPTTETRYRTETRTDSYMDADGTAHSDTYEVEVPYDWYVLTVTLAAKPFSDVTAARLSGEQLEHYAVLMQSKGSRQYLANPFGDLDWLPYVTSCYGYRIHPISGEKDLHLGVDIGLPQGTEIHAGQDGTVTFAGSSGDYGNVVVIEDASGLVSKYAHCDTLNVTAGQAVKTGDVIATVGNTGRSTGAHLHLEVLKNNVYLNPLYFAETGSFNLTLS
jgi:murein DD-endopeptidase MepM/ murein hydrolase activator NlpD